jgi:hypothetical protein
MRLSLEPRVSSLERVSSTVEKPGATSPGPPLGMPGVYDVPSFAER